MKFLRGTNITLAKEAKSRGSELLPGVNRKRALVSSKVAKAINFVGCNAMERGVIW
jgi:hypothetical protein